jgi:hypothetical protein
MKKLILPLMLAVAALTTGCQTDTGAYPPKNTQRRDLENRESFVCLDQRAQNSVTCTGLFPKNLEDGRLQVSANVRNRLNRRIQVQINCVFKNELGAVVEDVPWQDLILAENVQEGVTFTSLNNQSKKYVIRVRTAR